MYLECLHIIQELPPGDRERVIEIEMRLRGMTADMVKSQAQIQEWGTRVIAARALTLL